MKKTNEKLNTPCRNVVICGAYGADNIGDEAMLKAIIAQLRSLKPAPEICVVTRKPKQTKALHNVDAVFTFNYPALNRAFRKADVYLNGGGSLIQNVTSRRSLVYYLHTLKNAKKHGCTVIMYGCGIGPINGSSDIALSAKIINENVDAITLRESGSAALLEEIGVTKPEIVLAADPVLSLEPCSDEEASAFLSENGIDPNGKYICFGLRPWKGFQEKLDCIAEAVKYCSENLGLTPVFLPMNYGMDLSAAKAAAERAGVECHILPEIKDAALAGGIISKMQMVVSMRLHAVLFAASSSTPSVGISYDPKVSTFMEYTDCGKCLELNELSADALISAIKHELDRGFGSKRLEHIKALESLNKITAARYMGLEV